MSSAIKLFILPLIVTLVGCGASENKLESEQRVLSNKASVFEGTWQNPCQMEGSPLGLADYVENFLIISRGGYTKIQRGFSSPKGKDEPPCAGSRLSYTLQETGAFILKKHDTNVFLNDDSVWSNGQWGSIESLNRSFKLAPANLDTALKWRSNRLFDISKWELGKARVVTNRKAVGERPYPSAEIIEAIRYERPDDGQISLTFGALAAGSEKPVFDTSRSYKKLPGLPSGLKNLNENNTDFIQGHQGNQ